MTKSGARWLAGLGCALLLAIPALAQDAPAAPATNDADDIVVTGQAERPTPTRREVSRQARDISRTGNIYHEPMARIEDRLCPGVLGLGRRGATIVIDRLRYNAQALDMWLAEDDGTCTPNFIVAFVRNGREQVAELERTHGYMFQNLTRAEREELLAEDGPVRVWTNSVMRTRDGMPIQRRENLTDPPVVGMWMAHSKIYTNVREDIVSVIVVFDLDQVRGKTLVQLADYATMRGFAKTREVEGDAAIDTILGLFSDAREPPAEMTDFDQAYLRSLYRWIPNLPAAAKLLGVNRELGRVTEEEAAARE